MCAKDETRISSAHTFAHGGAGVFGSILVSIAPEIYLLNTLLHFQALT